MSDKKISSPVVAPQRPVTPTQSSESSRTATAPAAPRSVRDGFETTRPSETHAALGSRRDTDWWGGRPLGEARNAHRTNTKEQFEQGLNSSANFFEGDVRLEIDGKGIEMRHDAGHESGDNLTLKEWLTAGRDSGRGLKLDVKEPQHMAEILKEVRASGVPEERLMFNLGYGAMNEWGPKIREAYPNAYLALNPPTENTLTAADAQKMVDQARRLGGPVTFVVRENKLSPEAIKVLAAAGPISVWGSGVEDVPKRTEELRRAGVTGMIDISGPHHIGPGEVVDAGKNWVRTKLDKIF